MTRKVLITGGGGFIGGHLSESLLGEGADVTVVDNFATGKRANIEKIKAHIRLVECDINDTDRITDAMRGVDTVFHLAAIPSVPRSIDEPVPSHRANVDGTFSVLLAAKTAGVRRVVYAGSSSAYGDNPAPRKREDMPWAPKSPYAVQKLTGELYTLQFDAHFGVEGAVLRYFNVFGPRQDPASRYAGVIPLFISQIKRGEPPRINGDGSITRDFTYIDNVVDATKRAGIVPEARGKVFNAACGTSFSLMELVAAINGALGTAIAPTHGPERKGDIKASRADISLAQSILGYEPHVSFEEGIRRTVASFA